MAALPDRFRNKPTGKQPSCFAPSFAGFQNRNTPAMIERWLTTGATSARLNKMEPTDNSADGRFTLNVEFSANSMGN